MQTKMTQTRMTMKMKTKVMNETVGCRWSAKDCQTMTGELR